MRSSNIAEMAPIILTEIKKAQSILLHCHPSPDPDSVGSALAMKFVIESLGKKVTVIKGDSMIPQAFMHFPGAKDIVSKNFFEVDIKEFDLFLLVDTAAPDQISKLKKVVFPLSIKSIVIDHHASNPAYADINLIVPEAPATGQVLFDLFKEWGIEITHEIASNLFMGIYTDTLGLKIASTTPRTYEIMTELIKKVPDFSALISKMENSESPKTLVFYGLALSSIKTFLDDKFAIAAVTNDQLVENGIRDIRMSSAYISQMMRIVYDWKILATMVEISPGLVKCSIRTNDVANYPVDILAAAFGGGGHKAAAGTTFSTTIDEARKLIVSKAKELYNL